MESAGRQLKRNAIAAFPSESERKQVMFMASPQRRRYNNTCSCGASIECDRDYLKSFPPGYRFCPSDAELVVHYLMRKVRNQPLPKNNIRDVNLYSNNPDKLTENCRKKGETEWYFFTPRNRKYQNGSRPNRAAGNGYWKATGPDKIITHNGEIVGFRKALVFHVGKQPKGDKTNWIMHEFRVEKSPRVNHSKTDMRLGDWVLCRIYKKLPKGGGDNCNSKNDRQEEEEHNENSENTLVPVENNIGSTSNEQLLGTVVGYFRPPNYNLHDNNGAGAGVGVRVEIVPTTNGSFGVPHLVDDPFPNFANIHNCFMQNFNYGSIQPYPPSRAPPPMYHYPGENGNFMPVFPKQENTPTIEEVGDEGILELLESYFSSPNAELILMEKDIYKINPQNNPEINLPDDEPETSDDELGETSDDEPETPGGADLPDLPETN